MLQQHKALFLFTVRYIFLVPEGKLLLTCYVGFVNDFKGTVFGMSRTRDHPEYIVKYCSSEYI